MKAMPPIARLGFLLAEMNEAEQDVLLYIAERIHQGREVYGPLDVNDGRDWREERKQEAADWLVYRMIEEVAKQ